MLVKTKLNVLICKTENWVNALKQVFFKSGGVFTYRLLALL